MTAVQAVPPVVVKVTGARGESVLDVVRRLGLGGAPADASDASAMEYLAQYLVDNFDGTNLAATLAAAEIAQEFGSIWSTPFGAVQSSAPSSPSVGDKYIDTDDQKGYIFSNDSPNAWVGYTPDTGQIIYNAGDGFSYKYSGSAWLKRNSKLAFVSDFATLSACLTFAAAAGTRVIVDDDRTLAANTSISSSIPALSFEGGKITLGSFDLSFNGQAVRAEAEKIFVAASTGAVKGTIAGAICADWWGTTSASTADSATSAAGNAALTYIAQSDNPCAPLHFYKPKYYLSAQWVKPADGDYNSPSFYGHGAELHYDFNAAAAICLKGDSGALHRAEFSGFVFMGSATSWGLEIQGQSSIALDGLRFETNARGLVLHNKDADQFTEFVTWKNCTFAAACKQAWWFKITSGDQSFHGCGPVGNVTIEQSNPATGSAITADANAYVYNAPSDLQWFCFDETYPLYNLGTSGRLFLKGTITVENFSDGTPVIGGGNSGTQVLVGSTMCWGTALDLGKMTTMDGMSINVSGTIGGFMKRRTESAVMGSGGTTFTLKEWGNVDYIMNVIVTGPSYKSRQTVKTWLDFAGGNGVTVLGTDQNTYNGHGAPTYSWDGDTLTVSNAAFTSDYTVVVTFLDMDGHS